MKPLDHALISAHRFGGEPEDYLDIHLWFDVSKASFADVRHRALRHHSEGIFECASIFGEVMTNSEGKKFSVRDVGEQHVLDDLGFIPSMKDWFCEIQKQPWMRKTNRESVRLAKELKGSK